MSQPDDDRHEPGGPGEDPEVGRDEGVGSGESMPPVMPAPPVSDAPGMSGPPNAGAFRDYAIPAASGKPEGGSLGAGIGTGCGLMALAGVGGLYLAIALGGLWVMWVLAALVLVFAINRAMTPSSRRFGTGMLIVVVASVLLIMGPCTLMTVSI